MGLRINTNVQSLAAQRNLGTNNRMLGNSLEKLASGSRINRAADDAAGLAISDKMNASIRSLRQASRNANDGISMIQTAEGAMNEVGNMLVRMRELSIQGASDTVGASERGFIDKEVQALKSEVDRIAQSTEYNGSKVLNGEGGVLDFQIGMHNKDSEDRFQYDTRNTDVRIERLGLAAVATTSKESSQNNLGALDEAIRTLNENRSGLGALQNRMFSTINNLQIYDENLSAAKSRIRDVDMASETSEQTRQNILTQASTSVLAQANNNSQLALKLLS
jgi:flagellin